MSSSSTFSTPQKPDLTLFEITDRLELLAKALKNLSDPLVKRHIIGDMRTLLAEAEQRL